MSSKISSFVVLLKADIAVVRVVFCRDKMRTARFFGIPRFTLAQEAVNLIDIYKISSIGFFFSCLGAV
jgi:hypothetical protein